MDKRPRTRYNEQKRSKANISAVLRSIVAFYLAYLGWTVARNAGGPDTTMKSWMGWAVFGVFSLVAVAFEMYTLKRYQADLKNAELPPDEPARSDPESAEDDP